jgi:lauroyl/myristoyl acyltransferase
LREAQNPVKRWFTDHFNRLLEDRFACRFLWTLPDSFGVAVQAANALRKNEIVLVLVDLSFSAENVDVDFLGGPARFPAGPALLAEATGAPLLDYYIYRSKERPAQVAEIGPPATVTSGRTPEAVQECATRLETHIRRHPAGWSPWLIGDWKLFATWNDNAPWTFLDDATNRW